MEHIKNFSQVFGFVFGAIILFGGFLYGFTSIINAIPGSYEAAHGAVLNLGQLVIGLFVMSTAISAAVTVGIALDK